MTEQQTAHPVPAQSSHQERMMPAGRPTKYDPSYPEKARKACLLWGATDEELAKFFEVSIDTIHEWKKQHPEFSDALKNGKAFADAHVAERLYTKATGGDVEEEHAFCYRGEVIKTTIRKHIPPDVTACIFWLKNRQPSLWRDRKQLELEDQAGEPMAFPVMRIYGQRPEGGNA